MAGAAGLQLTRIDCGVIKHVAIPKDEAEHERRPPRTVNVARKHEIVGNVTVVEERIDKLLGLHFLLYQGEIIKVRVCK